MPPPMMTTFTPVSRTEFADHLHHRLHVLHLSLRQNPVPEIADVARSCAGALKQLANFDLELGKRSEQRHRVEIALDRRPVTDVHPSLIDIRPPIDAHHADAGRVVLTEED